MSGLSRISSGVRPGGTKTPKRIDDPKERARRRCSPRSRTSGMAAQFGQQGLDERGFARRRVVLRHDEIEHQQARRIPAGVDPREPREGVDQQARADQQHRGDHHLRDHEHAARAGVPRRAPPCPPALRSFMTCA